MKLTPYSSLFFGSRILAGKLAGVLLCVLLARVASAQLYVNSNSVSYFNPGTPAIPTIDATAFANQSVFSCTYNAFINNNVIYCEPWWGTLDYTNVGEMMVNAPETAPGLFDELTTGVGFKFDLQQNNSNQTNSMAGTFYNPGTIHCDSILDGNNQFFEATIGECIVSATNIIVPGNIEVGDNGLLSLNGQHVDLSHSVLTMEQGTSTSNNVNAAIASEGEGFDTNGDWNPFIDLEPPPPPPSNPLRALASFPDFLFLTNSLSYYGLAGGGSNFISRSVFIQNGNTNTPYSVFITPSLYGNEGALIQWTGIYINPASGNNVTNYLYLFHFYIDSTNLGPIVEFGTPASLGNDSGFFNFVWSQPTPISGLGTPTPTLYQNIFDDDFLTNIYEYFNATLDGTTVGTNASGTNPSGALTNLPNQVSITGSQELNLTSCQITGENYISLLATNQFDGSPGALINAPFYDMNLGVTNGTMTISNLVAQNIPTWGGLFQEWSSRWTNVSPTNASFLPGDNIDYRVMLVNSDLTPTINPQIQNLTLNATNSLVISDVLNVFNSLYATPVSLTLTTNGIGHGATSVEGELNLGNGNSVIWSWGGSFPNLLWLTNNGAIIIPNFSTFVGNSNMVTVTAGTPIVAATNTLSEIGTSNLNVNATVTVGPITTYTFTTAAITSATPAYTVEIGKTNDATMTNLIAAINFSAGAGKVYGTNGHFFANGFASAGPLINHAFTVTALVGGPSGNTIPVSTTATNLTWIGGASADLAGGANAVPGSTNIAASAVPYGAFISDNLFMDQGSTIWANNFLGSGVVSNGVGSFTLTALTATVTNCSLTAGGSVSITANTLLASNIVLQAGRSLTLAITDWLTDGGVTNGNMWSVNGTNAVGFDGQGLELPFLPTNTTPGMNNLLGTTIYVQAPAPNKPVSSTWAGQNYGTSTLGYMTNNVAIGQLILDAAGVSSSFYFNGAGVSNAMYVDRLVLEDFATYTNNLGHLYISALNINTNFVIYYADAVSSGQDVSSLINGFNTNRLIWVPEYTGFFSSTNLLYPNGATNRVNAGLAADPELDSNGNGIPNNQDQDPLFVSSQLNFSQSGNTIMWNSIPSATNIVLSSQNMFTWNVYTNFVSPPNVPPVGGWPIPYSLVVPTNGMVFYRVCVSPNNADVFGQ
jgi:hypothetical protein